MTEEVDSWVEALALYHTAPAHKTSLQYSSNGITWDDGLFLSSEQKLVRTAPPAEPRAAPLPDQRSVQAMQSAAHPVQRTEQAQDSVPVRGKRHSWLHLFRPPFRYAKANRSPLRFSSASANAVNAPPSVFPGEEFAQTSLPVSMSIPRHAVPTESFVPRHSLNVSRRVPVQATLPKPMPPAAAVPLSMIPAPPVSLSVPAAAHRVSIPQRTSLDTYGGASNRTLPPPRAAPVEALPPLPLRKTNRPHSMYIASLPQNPQRPQRFSGSFTAPLDGPTRSFSNPASRSACPTQQAAAYVDRQSEQDAFGIAV